MSTPTPQPIASTSTNDNTRPTRSLNRQVVLEEDEYTEALSQIIARDFFPSLVHLDATNDYLDALRSDDPALLEATVRRLEEISTPATRRAAPYQTPSQTPYGLGPSDTPMRTPRGEAPTKRARYDTDMSLDAFQAKYTSEDNSSFTQILEDENKKRKEKYGWAWEAQKKVEAQRDRMIEQRERSLIEAPPVPGVREKLTIDAPAPVGLITNGESSREAEEEKEEGDEGQGKEVALKSKEEDVSLEAPRQKKDTRSAGVDAWKFKTRNALMFPPDADVAPYDPSFKSQDDSKPDPKVIKYGNTRLPEQDDTPSGSISAPSSPTRSRVDAAIAGTPYRPRSPTINNFSLVPSIPSPTPSQLGPAAVKQLMTLGTITGTPRIISNDDDEVSSMPPPSTPFHLPAPSSREVLSHKLSSKAAKSLKAKADLLNGTPRNKRGSMPPPSFTPKRADAAGNLTPAARRLLNRTAMGTAAARRADAMGRTAGWEGSSGGRREERDLNRVRWTPTPSPVTRRAA